MARNDSIQDILAAHRLHASRRDALGEELRRGHTHGACGLGAGSGMHCEVRRKELGKVLPRGSTMTGLMFGYSVAIHGDTAVVGAPYDDTAASNAGAVYIYVRTAGVWVEQQRVTASVPGADDNFGWMVSLSGDTLLVGSPRDDDGGADSGTAYVFTRSGGVWTEQQLLVASDDDAGDFFGWSVSVCGDTAVVGAYKAHAVAVADAGAVYVFTRSAGVWTEQQILVASDPETNAYLGYSVSVHGDTLIAGASKEDNAGGADAGSVYVFTRTAGVWTEQQKLVASDGAASATFGSSVALYGDTAVVGAFWASPGGLSKAGSAYVFTRTLGVWTEQQILEASDGAADDNFGYSVAVVGDTLLVGAFGEDAAGVANSGSAYVFKLATGTWTEQRKLVAPCGTVGGFFGSGVALDGDRAIIGACGATTALGTSGAAYLFAGVGVVWTEQQKLLAVPECGGDALGYSVAIDGDTMIVGAPIDNTAAGVDVGAAYVFVRVGGVWALQQKLVASDAAASDYFGWTVAVDGDTAVVSGWQDDNERGANAGAAYVFTRTAGVWTQQQKLVASDGVANDYAGMSVAVYGDTAVVCASKAHVGAVADAGKAYVYTRAAGVWTEQQKLVASDPGTNDYFGYVCSLYGDTLIVGAAYDDNAGGVNAGSAYVFTRTLGVWTEQQKLVASDPAAGDFFGWSVALYGDTAVVGAYKDHIGAEADAGAVYVFTRTLGVWTEQQKLVASDGLANDQFGMSVAVYGDTAVIGAVRDDTTGGVDAGSAYVFTRTLGVWTEQQKLLPTPDPDELRTDAWFGNGVAIDGDTAVVGAPQDDNARGTDAGAAWVYTRSGGVWTLQQKLVASDGAAGDKAGNAVAVDGDTVVVGAYKDHVGATADAGSVYVYTLVGGVWTEQQHITASDPGTNDYFGSIVAIDGDTLIVGAYKDDNAKGTDAGAAYVYTRTAGVWTEQQKLIASDGVASDQFGLGVSVYGDTAVVSTAYAHVGGVADVGAAYVFTRSGGVWTEQQKLVPSDPETNGYFGNRATVYGDTIAVSGMGKDTAIGVDSGAIYIFTRTDGVWTEQQQILPPDGSAGDMWGGAVSLCGETLLTSANVNDVRGVDAGAAYVLTRSGGVWTLQTVLYTEDAAAGDYLAQACALSGDTVILGCIGNDDQGSNSGSAYIFTRSADSWVAE